MGDVNNIVLKDKVGPQGRLKVDVFEDITKHINDIKAGKMASIKPDYTAFCEPNVVLNQGREHFLKLFSNLSSDHATKMAVGDGGATLADPFVPIPPDITDTDLANKIVSQEVSSINTMLAGTPAQYLVEYVELFVAADYFVSTLPWIDSGQKVLNEAAIVTWFAELACTRKTFPSIPWDPATNIAARFTWDIYVN